MQTKAQADGERTRWATDAENAGRTFVRLRATDRGSRCWDALAINGARLTKVRVGGVGVGLPSDCKRLARAGVDLRGKA